MPPVGEKSMQERLAKMEAMVEEATRQYLSILPRLDAIMAKLSEGAVAANDITHLKAEQKLQWEKIDAHKKEWKQEAKELGLRIDNHMTSCSGIVQVREEAREAKNLAETARTAAEAAATNTAILPGKFAIIAIGVLVTLGSSILGGFILHILTK